MPDSTYGIRNLEDLAVPVQHDVVRGAGYLYANLLETHYRIRTAKVLRSTNLDLSGLSPVDYIKAARKAQVFVPEAAIGRITRPETCQITMEFDKDDEIDLDVDLGTWIKPECRRAMERALVLKSLIGTLGDDHIRPVYGDPLTRHITVTLNDPSDAVEVHSKCLNAMYDLMEADQDVAHRVFGDGNVDTDGFLLAVPYDIHRLQATAMDSDGRLIYGKHWSWTFGDQLTLPTAAMPTRTVGNVTKKPLMILLKRNAYVFGCATRTKPGTKVPLQSPDRVEVDDRIYTKLDLNTNKTTVVYEMRAAGALCVPYGAYVIEVNVD